MLWIAALSLFGAALTGWFAWIMADPNFSTGARRAAFLQDVPVAIRVGFLGLCTLACLYAFVMAARAAGRTDASFSIGPDGVADLRKTPPRRLGWNEIGAVSADANFLYVKPHGATGRTFAGGGRISIPLKGVTPGRDTILAAFDSPPPG
jgi:hypothetical protein